MSTRALYTFKGSKELPGNFNIYKHHDGYPTGALNVLQETLKYAWELPRYESDEFAAAFCTAGKMQSPTSGGGVRLMPGGDPAKVADKHCGDIEYRYEISLKGTDLHVKAMRASGEVLFTGTFAAFAAWAPEFEKQAKVYA